MYTDCIMPELSKLTTNPLPEHFPYQRLFVRCYPRLIDVEIYGRV